MKEAERQILQDTLHKEVIRKIILLQSWLRMVLERRRFLRLRQAAVVLQVSSRIANLIFLTTNKQTVSCNTPHLEVSLLYFRNPEISLCRRAGGPAVSGWLCRGTTLPSRSRRPGGGTGSGNASCSSGGEFVSCRPWPGGTCSVRGKGEGAMWHENIHLITWLHLPSSVCVLG